MYYTLFDMKLLAHAHPGLIFYRIKVHGSTSNPLYHQRRLHLKLHVKAKPSHAVGRRFYSSMGKNSYYWLLVSMSSLNIMLKVYLRCEREVSACKPVAYSVYFSLNTARPPAHLARERLRQGNERAPGR